MDVLPQANYQVDFGGKNEGLSTSLEVASGDEYRLQFLPQDDNQFIETTDIIDPEYVMKTLNMSWEEFINYNPFVD